MLSVSMAEAERNRPALSLVWCCLGCMLCIAMLMAVGLWQFAGCCIISLPLMVSSLLVWPIAAPNHACRTPTTEAVLCRGTGASAPTLITSTSDMR
jgi:hypothetical protein